MITPELEDKLRKFFTTDNIDMHGKKVVNAGKSIELSDYVTKQELLEAEERIILRLKQAFNV